MVDTRFTHVEGSTSSVDPHAIIDGVQDRRNPTQRCLQTFQRCVLRFRKVATTILAVVNVSLFTAADRVASMRLDIVTIAFGTAPLREGHIISSFTELIVPLSYVRLSHLAISHSTNPVPTPACDAYYGSHRSILLRPGLGNGPEYISIDERGQRRVLAHRDSAG